MTRVIYFGESSLHSSTSSSRPKFPMKWLHVIGSVSARPPLKQLEITVLLRLTSTTPWRYQVPRALNLNRGVHYGSSSRFLHTIFSLTIARRETIRWSTKEPFHSFQWDQQTFSWTLSFPSRFLDVEENYEFSRRHVESSASIFASKSLSVRTEASR